MLKASEAGEIFELNLRAQKFCFMYKHYGIEKFYCQKCPENNIVLRLTHLVAHAVKPYWPQPFVAWRYRPKKCVNASAQSNFHQG